MKSPYRYQRGDRGSTGASDKEAKVEHHTWSYSNFLEMRERLEALVRLIAYSFPAEADGDRVTNISQSALIVAAVEALLDASSPIDHLAPFVGVIKGAPPGLSESIDDIYR